MSLRYLNFCPDLFVCVRKRLDKKASVNFKIYDFINWETNYCKHVVPNISVSKNNYTMTFSELIWHGKYFSRKNIQKVGRRNYSQTLFWKNQNWTYLWMKSLKFCRVCFTACPSRGLSKCIKVNVLNTYFYFTSHKAFLKNKKRSEASLPASFSAWVLKKIIWFHCVIAFVYEIFGNMCNEECPLGQYSMYNISRDVGKHYIQYIMNNCSLMITNICIFVSTLKSLISKTNKKIFDDFLNYGEAAAIRLYS